MDAFPEKVRAALSSFAGNGGDWYGNWPLNSPRVLGERGTFRGDFFTFGGQSGFQFETDPDQVTRDQWTYLDADGSTVDIGTDVTVPGWQFLGSAKAGIQIQFARHDSLYLAATTSRIERAADVDALKKQLLGSYTTGTYPIGTAIVVERLVAHQALLIASKSAGSSLNATISGDFTGAGGGIASFAGRLNIVGSRSGTDIEQYAADAVTLAFRAVILVKRGWLWWRHVNVMGLAPQDPEATIAVLSAMAAPTDYFAEF